MAGDGWSEDQDRARLILPQMRLDDLLGELQSRLQTVLATRDRVHALLEAVVSIGSNLELEAVLQRIIEVATSLVDARYGALGVIGDDGEHLERFITVGVAPAEIEAIGHWPHGRGILGLLIREPHPLRLADLAAHPASTGFPANHPPMRGFLGVPIRVRDEVFGNLYLTEKAGGGEFDEEDQVIVTALATAAGVAIENARLFDETRQRERWVQASSDVSNALLSGQSPEDVLGLVADRARDICDADVAAVSLADGGSTELKVVAVAGAGSDRLLGLRVPVDEALAGPVFRTGEAMLVDDAQEEPEGSLTKSVVPVGPALIVPLGQEGKVRGALAVINGPGGRQFTEATRRSLVPFAIQAAVALELAEARRDADRLTRLEDRDRIAKDLHDTVIQRLFATAMSLMSAVKLTDKPEVARRVQTSVDDLDDTIRQIRSTIFALQADPDEESLRSRIYGLVDGAGGVLGFAPSARLDGPIDSAVDAATAEHLLAVVNEALSNIVRHAHARHVSLDLVVGRDIALRVEDDGVGIGETGRRSGLRNMAERAAALGGTFDCEAGDNGGTVLRWRVPLM